VGEALAMIVGTIAGGAEVSSRDECQERFLLAARESEIEWADARDRSDRVH